MTPSTRRSILFLTLAAGLCWLTLAYGEGREGTYSRYSQATQATQAALTTQKIPGLETRESKAKDGSKVIEVVAPLYFKLVFSGRCRVLRYPGESAKVGSRITATYDLENDPEQKINLSSSNQDLTGDGIIEGDLLLVESTPARAIIDMKGFLGERTAGTETEIVRRYVIYPTGQIYVRETHSGPPAEKHLGPYVNSACAFTAADEHADPGAEGEFFWLTWGGERYLSDKVGSFCMYHSNARHPTSFKAVEGVKERPILDAKADILHVLHFQKARAYYVGRWAHSDALGDLNMRWRPVPPWDVPHSRTFTFLLQIKPDTMDDNKVVLPYVHDYRNPAHLEFKRGQAVTTHRNDLNHDGYDESEGCYVMQAAAGRLEFVLDGAKHARFNPVFKVLNWPAIPLQHIKLGDRELIAEQDYRAAQSGKDLIIQYVGTADTMSLFHLSGEGSSL